MTLFGSILKKVQSIDSFPKKYSSPPPERAIMLPKKKKKYVDKFAHVPARVDNSPPMLDWRAMYRNLSPWTCNLKTIYWENVKLLADIKRQHFQRGKVDCRWRHPPEPCMRYYHARRECLKHVQSKNKHMYQLIENAVKVPVRQDFCFQKARVTTTKCLRRDWVHNRRRMIEGAQKTFILFEPEPKEDIEDVAFVSPEDAKRPRVHIKLGVVGAASLGELTVELFTEVCPATCRLFLELLDGDGLGHGYVGTCFFTKVPGLYWAGGDVIHNNGFGCYAQRGRQVPIGAENYHFSHSMPGLLSMRMTSNDEMCGSFNITFKALPQFDLRNVVFGRVVRPCSTYSTICQLGSPLSTQPVVTISETRRREAKICLRGQANTRLTRRRY